MSSLPPPYSSSDAPQRGGHNNEFPSRYLGVIRNVIIPQSRQVPANWPYSDAEYYCRHDIYITKLVESSSSRGRSINTVHFCKHDESSAPSNEPTFVSIAGDINPESLKMVQGFQYCGSFNFPTVVNSTDDAFRQRLHNQLPHILLQLGTSTATKLALELSTIGGRDVSPEIVSDGVYQANVHIYKIDIFSKYANGFSDSMCDCPSMLYKWAKPQSVYGDLNGFWETNLVNVINDGALNAGGELKVLARGIFDQEMADFRSKWHEGTRLF